MDLKSLKFYFLRFLEAGNVNSPNMFPPQWTMYECYSTRQAHKYGAIADMLKMLG